MDKPPDVGKIITISHEGISSSGKYKSPQFVREREDITWSDVISENKLSG